MSELNILGEPIGNVKDITIIVPKFEKEIIAICNGSNQNCIITIPPGGKLIIKHEEPAYGVKKN